MRRFTTADGTRLAYRVYGPAEASPTVFLAHCWTLNQEDWHYQVRALQAEFGHRIRIVTWDHRGHGESDKLHKPGCTLDLLGRDMGELVDHLAPEGPLVLAGHSIGGMTLMALAEQRPDITGRTVAVAFVSTSSGELDTVTLGMYAVNDAGRGVYDALGFADEHRFTSGPLQVRGRW